MSQILEQTEECSEMEFSTINIRTEQWIVYKIWNNFIFSSGRLMDKLYVNH